MAGHWTSRFYCETCNQQFWSQSDADQHRMTLGHWRAPKTNPTQLLPPHNSIYSGIKKMFDDGWRHPQTSGSLSHIYIDKDLCDKAAVDLASGRAWLVFHGTQRACHFGDPGQTLTPCNNTECHVCGILRDGFKLSRASPNSMFGRGIYSTTVSSKADRYAKNHHMRSRLHVMLMCAGCCGQPERLYQADHGRTRPSPGYDFVMAPSRQQGGIVEYDEMVWYEETKIIPFGLVVYTRDGWQPQ